MRSPKLRNISDENFNELLTKVRQNLDKGFSGEAEKSLVQTLETNLLNLEQQAKLQRLLSYALETKGTYKESLEALEYFDDDEILAQLSVETRTRVLTQLGIAFNNLADSPKAIALLEKARKEAEENNLSNILGSIFVAISRVYRKLNEFSMARSFAEKALNYFRENGNWRGMAESYQVIGATNYQEGRSEKALENYEQGIKIIGSRSAPFLLGRIYSDMSGVYWRLRRSQDGISCLEKSIKFFDQTEHKLNSVIAYNNLGMNLMLLGDWTRAEAMMRRALEIASEAKHAHVAGILDSIGELKLMRGELDEAQNLLEESVNIAIERKMEWYQIQSLRNLSRTFLLKNELAEAEKTALETIALCEKMGEVEVLNMARLVLAEVYLQDGEFSKCEAELETIEQINPTSDFFVLGNIQRIRGIFALKINDNELAIHHFSRALTIFETAEDLYHTALTHYLIGRNVSQSARATKHLLAASEIFRKLGVKTFFEETSKLLGNAKKRDAAEIAQPAKTQTNSAGSQLLMLRLAEAVASRELLFRELVAILNQESKADKIIVAEMNEHKKYYPFITHGCSPNESMELVTKFQEAQFKNEAEKFAKVKNLQIFPLRAPSALPAVLIISPQTGAILNDETSILPLLRVVELGMDVCALRERDKTIYEDETESPFTSNSLMPGFIHSSPAMTALVEEVYKIRSSDVTVLVTGESGTGKELVSRAIHTISNRKDKIFVPFNCTAVPKELAEGHLFGYRKGAFTGAVTDSPGIIRAADGGTLFLDEVGDLPLDVQPKLLRFLQEGEVQPIGERRPIQVDVRIIAATNMPLEEKVADGSFREDLYYRLNVIRLRVPPLRERRSEIPPIVNYYINQYSSRFHKRNITISPQTIDLLMVCEWEGNVRQLCNEIQRIIARAEDGEKITPAHLSIDLKRSATPIMSYAEGDNVRRINSFNSGFSGFNVGTEGATLEEAVAELETQMINDSLRRHNWNISRVARELGLTRRGLYMKIERYGIQKAA